MAYVAHERNLQFIRALASAIGFDPDKNPIVSIVIESSVNDIAIATVKMLVHDGQDKAISEVVKRYAFCEV
jgi:hypothetical protein